MDGDYPMQEPHYQHHRQWLPHLLPVPRAQSAFSSPASPATDYGQPFFQEQSPQLTLNTGLASLSVASSSNQSPINPTPSSALPPGTPASTRPPYAISGQFAYLPEQPTRSPTHAFHPDHPTPSTSASESSSSLSKKTSFTNTSATTLPDVDEADDQDDLHMSSSYPNQGTHSPVDGSSGEEQPSAAQPLPNAPSTMTSTGKPLSSSNNFVSKLYQMINDPKSAQFIAWTELGTSFVVSNVGEFSRSILGSHFKHNNFASFVRQLNMYGFHKINKTPRAQRTSIDTQTWEFSHRKFLRGRPDLLDEIKRKALEPDLGARQRVELPGEVAAQLNAMRSENRRVWEQLGVERIKVDRLSALVNQLWDVVGKNWPGHLPPFPADLVDETPNIYVTQPPQPGPPGTAHGHTHMPLPSPLSVSSINNFHAQHSLTPNSSPTTADFPAHLHNHGHHVLTRQHSYQHLSFTRNSPSPSASMEDVSGNGRKRQRTADDTMMLGSLHGANQRKRSDSAPLGTYGAAHYYTQRPRSGGVGVGVLPNIGGRSSGSSTGGGATPGKEAEMDEAHPPPMLPVLTMDTMPSVSEASH